MGKYSFCAVGTLALLLAAGLITFFTIIVPTSSQEQQCLNDRHRPQLHYSPAANWMNDPNGMVYYNGVYHLFYQHHPYSTLNGPMHWGHAISLDMVHWNETQVALYPDPLGVIFSGSAIVDFNNVTGLANRQDLAPIVAFYTSSLNQGGDNWFQQQSIAYSNDNGVSFAKYAGNPVLPNPDNIPNIRDPKIIPYEDHWIMALAVGHRIQFYESYNLMNWTLAGEFGEEPPVGAHGGVWECPDLMRFEWEGREIWVLFVSLDRGGPNGNGSSTQYFLGDFDGKTFNSHSLEKIQWLDFGPDNYAGVTFANEPLSRHIYIAWMSNWIYAREVPTVAWRGQMTLPRALSLGFVDGRVKLISQPAPEVNQLRNSSQLYEGGPIQVQPSVPFQLFANAGFRNPLLEVDLQFNLSALAFNDVISVCFNANSTQEVCVTYEVYVNRVFLDRGRSGQVDFSTGFNERSYAERLTTSKILDLKIFLDVSSIEIFIDGGFSTLTGLFFPDEPFYQANVNLYSSGGGGNVSRLGVENFTLRGLNSIYNC